MSRDQQLSLFGGGEDVLPAKAVSDEIVTKRVLVTVTAAPNPSERHGETVCVAGIEVGPDGASSWIRLYPVNLRHLQANARFHKYDKLIVDCKPARQDSRTESWKPLMSTVRVEGKALPAWDPRRSWVEPLITDDMCSLRKAAADSPQNQSLALIRPSQIKDFVISPHPGWTSGEAAKIDAYVNQMDLFDESDKTPLEAPAYRGHYKWTCAHPQCRDHEMGLIDWEFVALQRHLRGRPDSVMRDELRRRWLDQVCAPERDVAFYVGNQAKRSHVFSVLGVWWPLRR